VPTFTLGRQTIYRLGYQGESVDQPAAVFGATTPKSHVQRVFTTVAALLTETVVAHDATRSTILVEIVQPKISFSAEGTLADALYETKLASDLRESYTLQLDSSGKIERIAPPPGASALGLGFVRTIAGAVTIATPSKPSRLQTRWEATEPDADGNRHGSYALDRFVADPLGSASVGFRRTTNVKNEIV